MRIYLFTCDVERFPRLWQLGLSGQRPAARYAHVTIYL